MTTTATTVRPLSTQRPTVKQRVAAMGGTPTTPPAVKVASLYCKQCAHPSSELAAEGCNHLDADGGIHVLCSCATGGGAQ